MGIISGHTLLTTLVRKDEDSAKRQVLEPFCARSKIEAVGPRGELLTLSYGLSMAGYDVRLDQDVTLGPSTSFESFSLASTKEHFCMPPDMLAIAHDKSTWARLGLSVFNTVIEPGWRGWLTMELSNRGPLTLRLKKGWPIAQVVFHRVEGVVEQYGDSKYQNQPRGPVEAR